MNRKEIKFCNSCGEYILGYEINSYGKRVCPVCKEIGTVFTVEELLDISVSYKRNIGNLKDFIEDTE